MCAATAAQRRKKSCHACSCRRWERSFPSSSQSRRSPSSYLRSCCTPCAKSRARAAAGAIAPAAPAAVRTVRPARRIKKADSKPAPPRAERASEISTFAHTEFLQRGSRRASCAAGTLHLPKAQKNGVRQLRSKGKKVIACSPRALSPGSSRRMPSLWARFPSASAVSGSPFHGSMAM